MADTTAQTTIIGADARFSGELNFEGTARILGTFEGRITSKGELQIAEGATCKATIEVGRLYLEGTVEGDVTARERLELSAKAKLKGNVVSPRLTVAEGATVIGHVTVGEGTSKADQPEASSVETKPGVSQPARAPVNGFATNTFVTSGSNNRSDFRTEARPEVIARR